ncbi:auxin-responsive protein IAA2-like [Phalaenopsis equestris]|uniref:auxin-responsive protein IAA2-like n=1 Tax=Phalaenopsis equestris TaxID=78828 RepID=UPI0009E288FF|nr:auxin-responsive protein IAA2-like [Phalaenopsis equestris]
MDRDVRRGGCFEEDEERKLELRLAPPGEDWLESKVEDDKDHIFNSGLSLNPFPNASKSMAAHLSAGAKRGFFESTESKTDALQQQEKTDFRHLQIKPELEKDILQRTNGRADRQLSVEVKKCCLPLPISATSSGSLAVAHNSSQIRSASTPVVGWPPIRSSRKHLTTASKQAVELKSVSSESKPKNEPIRKTFFVKINMEGIPIGRKIDLLAFDCYEKLSSAVDELFRDLLAAQMEPIAAIKENVEKHAIRGLLDGSGEYTLIYEDEEGDRMLVGDVPWEMFVSTAKRLRVLKSSEVSSSSSSMRTFCRKKKSS